ncbi:DKNYY domain-containing protein [Adhaeribacter swui]|uniref:DKNYY domain-containing protein n=1 Tax=Adhaeribacter swui TaxID=2086471 RepID=A0A7G7G7V3_9BACT|nr:DKNYY domain-containing protein [Adhaeribacter swui]QNF33237.1 DKNYY domain-containing protein [Adhaeribacter swui]
MILRYLVLTILTILLLTSCKQGYKVEDEKVYYEYWNEGSGQNKRLLEHADAKTFQILSFDCDCSFKFGKDKNHLYIDGELIKNIDPHTFQFIGNYIFRDKDSAYFFGFYNNLNNCAIKGIRPDDIELIEYPWAKAGNILIHGGDTLFLDDINDFVPIDRDWGKTKQYVINGSQIIYGADVKTFKVINGYSGEDKEYKYEFGVIADEDLNKESYKEFNFDKTNFCELEPTEFSDIYSKLVPYDLEQSKQIMIVEKLKSKGFSIQSSRQRNSGESKIISVTLINDKCNCYVNKYYHYDYSRPSELEKLFKVTERIHCRTIK